MKKLLFFLFTLSFVLKGQVCFNPYVSDSSGGHQADLTSADFNSDGFQDIATANSTAGNVSVLLGIGQGTFTIPTNYTVGTNASPALIGTGDFNEDGNADIVSANQGVNTITLLNGNGLGSFTLATAPLTTFWTSGLLINDLDMDGHADIIITATSTYSVSVFYGNGLGMFPFDTSYSMASGIRGISCGDFNNDGKKDLGLGSGNNVIVLLANGTRSLGFGAAYALSTQTLTPANPIGITCADFNGDGNLDLATSNNSYENLSVLLGTGTGSFGSLTTYSVGGGGTSDITCADFDGDGKLDIAMTNSAGYPVDVLVGNGAGVFGPVQHFPAGNNAMPASIIAVDLDNNGNPDLAIADYNSNNVQVLLNCQGIGMDALQNEKDPIVYPNPSNGIYTLGLGSESEPGYYEITDLMGRIIYKRTNQLMPVRIDITAFPAGIYYLKVSSVDGNRTEKIIKE